MASERAFSSRRARWTAPPLTSLSRCKPTSLWIDQEGSSQLTAPRPLHLAQREPYVATPARGAFALSRNPTRVGYSRTGERAVGLRWAMQHNFVDQVALANSRVSARDLIPSSTSFGGEPARRRIALTFCCFRLGDAAPTTRDTEPRAPSRPTGGASRRSRWPARGCRQCTKPTLAGGCMHRFGSESSRGCEGCARLRRACDFAGEPRLAVSRTPRVTQSCPQSVGTTRYVRAMGRRPPRSARRRPLRDTRASVTRPAKGEILVKIEVPSVRSTEPSTRGWRVRTRARFPSSTSVTRWSSVPRRLVDRDESR